MNPTPINVASTTEAQARVRKALEHIERAQRELSDASSTLSSVEGVLDQWELLGKLYDQVKAAWHDLNSVPDDKVDLDEMSKDSWTKKNASR